MDSMDRYIVYHTPQEIAAKFSLEELKSANMRTIRPFRLFIDRAGPPGPSILSKRNYKKTISFSYARNWIEYVFQETPPPYPRPWTLIYAAHLAMAIRIKTQK